MNTSAPIDNNRHKPTPSKIAITGSRGYIGQRLTLFLQKQNYQVVTIDRSLLYGPIDELMHCISDCYAVINLAGASINQRWSKKNKELIYNSRILTTRQLVKAINTLNTEQRPKHFLSVSAVGIYQNDIKHTEESQAFDSAFLGTVVKDWENEIQQLSPTVKQSIFRLGLVLGKDAKIIQRLSPVFKLGIGGAIGSGKQAFPYIHINDVLRAFLWAIEESKTGTYNLCTQEYANNKDFTLNLAKGLNRPAIFNIPPFILRLMFGEMAIIVLKSPIVDASKIAETGFNFSVNSIKDTILKSLP